EEDGIVAGPEAGFVEDVADVVLDRVLGDEELLRDLLGGEPLGDLLQDLDLSPGQGGLARDGYIARAQHAGYDFEQLGRHLRRRARSPRFDVAQRRHQALERGVFGVVAAGSGLDGRQEVFARLGGSQEDYRRFRRLLIYR